MYRIPRSSAVQMHNISAIGSVTRISAKPNHHQLPSHLSSRPKNSPKGLAHDTSRTRGILLGSISNGALTSVLPALRNLFASVMRSAGRYVSGTKTTRAMHSATAQMTRMYQVQRQLRCWLMKPERMGPATGPRKGEAVSGSRIR